MIFSFILFSGDREDMGGKGEERDVSLRLERVEWEVGVEQRGPGAAWRLIGTC